jgi:hypothetical protein
MATPSSPEEVIRQFADLLGEARIPYMLTGSFASGFFGAPRATQDIDIVISPSMDSLSVFVRSLDRDRYYVSHEAAVKALGRESLFNIIDMESGWKVDLICRKSRPFSLTEFQRRAAIHFGGGDVYVATPEDIILSKLEWSKEGGSERQIEDAIAVLRIQGVSIDDHYLDHWAEKLELQDELSRARGRVVG